MGIEVSKAEPTAVLERGQLAGVRTPEVAKWWFAFRKHCPYFAFNAFMFEDFFCVTLPSLPNTKEAAPQVSAEVMQNVFASLDEAGRGLADGFEFFAALVILSKGSVVEKMNLLFNIFDVNGKGFIGQTALCLLLERSFSGMSKCCSCLGIVMHPGLPTKMARRAFAGKVNDEEISKREFQEWWERETAVRRVMQKFSFNPEEEAGLPGEGHWRSEVYTELDAKDTAPLLMNTKTEGTGKGAMTRNGAREAAVAVLEVVMQNVAEKGAHNATRSPFARWQAVY